MSKITLYQNCKTNGIVKRSSENLNLCDDPTCPTCQEWDHTIREEWERDIERAIVDVMSEIKSKELTLKLREKLGDIDGIVI